MIHLPHMAASMFPHMFTSMSGLQPQTNACHKSNLTFFSAYFLDNTLCFKAFLDYTPLIKA